MSHISDGALNFLQLFHHFARDIATFHAKVLHVVSKTAELDQSKPIIVWCVLDGKAGHEAQTKGLVNALGRRCAVQVHDIPGLNRLHALYLWMIRGFAPGQNLPSPDLIIGAGHRTHFSLLAARRA
ncbi:MAG: ELM1/GtrOC1 family putative glycosyltransferase, partial [Lentimonas sp.]